MDRFAAAALLSFLAVFITMAAAEHAETSPEEYWKKAFPNLPLPRSFAEKLKPGVIREKTAGSAGVGDGARLSPQMTMMMGRKGMMMMQQSQAGGSGESSSSALSAHSEDYNHFHYFFDTAMQVGSNFTLSFSKSYAGEKFLSRAVADAIPFSSAALPDILRRFSIDPASQDAELMGIALAVCEDSGINGEVHACPTSLEAMVDFIVSQLGREAEPLFTEIWDTRKQVYTVASPGPRMVAFSKLVTCHPLPYPYAAFYCHILPGTVPFLVPLQAEDGRRVEAVVACHFDTVYWNKGDEAFGQTGVLPGTLPVCHFMPTENVLWVQKY